MAPRQPLATDIRLVPDAWPAIFPDLHSDPVVGRLRRAEWLLEQMGLIHHAATVEHWPPKKILGALNRALAICSADDLYPPAQFA